MQARSDGLGSRRADAPAPFQRSAALVFPERRSGHVILLLGAILGLGVVVLHMNGARIGEIGRSSGGFFFVWTLFAFGATSLVSLVLAAHGLWRMRGGQPR